MSTFYNMGDIVKVGIQAKNAVGFSWTSFVQLIAEIGIRIWFAN